MSETTTVASTLPNPMRKAASGSSSKVSQKDYLRSLQKSDPETFKKLMARRSMKSTSDKTSGAHTRTDASSASGSKSEKEQQARGDRTKQRPRSLNKQATKTDTNTQSSAGRGNTTSASNSTSGGTKSRRSAVSSSEKPRPTAKSETSTPTTSRNPASVQKSWPTFVINLSRRWMELQQRGGGSITDYVKSVDGKAELRVISRVEPYKIGV